MPKFELYPHIQIDIETATRKEAEKLAREIVKDLNETIREHGVLHLPETEEDFIEDWELEED